MARVANRQNKIANISNKKVWYVGFYIRLSREDKRNLQESESVTNQKLILDDWFDNQGNDGDEYVFVDYYIDDGISGTTDEERDDFQRLLGDIETKTVNCVVVKNLARSFRNLSDQTYYLEEYFFVRNIRFVSLYNQTMDTYLNKRSASDMGVKFQGMSNEAFVQQTSDSVRTTFDKKRKDGLHIGSFARYGFLKHPDNKNLLIIDEVAAAIMIDIKTMLFAGMSLTAIVYYLNDHGIPCPYVYKTEVLGYKYRNPKGDTSQKPLWTTQTVRRLLLDPMNCGDMVQGRNRVISYKIHKQIRPPESEWFIKENTHPRIWSREDHDKIVKILTRDTRTAPQGKGLYLFSGFLLCADCGKAMTRSPVKNIVYYYCKTYKSQSKKACTKHTVRHEQLEAAVLYAIQQQVYLAVSFSDTIAKINKATIQKSQTIKLTSIIEQKEKELVKILRYKQSLWQDWKDGTITQIDYLHMRKDYEEQAESLSAVVENLKAEQAEVEKGIGVENPYLVSFRKYQNIDTLSREVLIELVDHIKVHDNGSISVKFKFSNEMRRVYEFIKANTHEEAV